MPINPCNKTIVDPDGEIELSHTGRIGDRKAFAKINAQPVPVCAGRNTRNDVRLSVTNGRRADCPVLVVKPGFAPGVVGRGSFTHTDKVSPFRTHRYEHIPSHRAYQTRHSQNQKNK